MMSLYVYSITIICGSCSLNILKCWLQVAGKISQWALENMSYFSAMKTQCVCFTSTHEIHPHSTPCLQDICLLFIPFVTFFVVLVFDSNPCKATLLLVWKDPQYSKVLSGSLWGRCRTVMLCLYHALIHSKIDCGNLICGSKFKSQLSM
jgi:hypothetical protein